MKILVIDDDDITRAMICELLLDSGFAVVDLPSAIGATRAIIEHQIEVLVVDLFMPSMTGDKLAKLVRGNSRTAHVSIILVSSMDAEPLERLRAESGADAAIQKDQVHTALPRALHRLVRRRNSDVVVKDNGPGSVRPSSFKRSRD